MYLELSIAVCVGFGIAWGYGKVMDWAARRSAKK